MDGADVADCAASAVSSCGKVYRARQSRRGGRRFRRVGGRGPRVRGGGGGNRGVTGFANQDGHRVLLYRDRGGLCNCHGDVGAVQNQIVVMMEVPAPPMLH